MDTRFLQSATALTAFVLGGAAILYAPSRLIDEALHPLVITILSAWFALLVVIASAAIVDARCDSTLARAMLWCASMIFFLSAAAMMATIGWLFLPAATFGVTSAFLSEPRTATD